MILPEAHHSCFVNMKEGARYGDYIGYELPDIVNHETQYSLKYCARMLLDSEKPLPRIYHACGRMDPWYEMNQMVRGFFEGLKENPYRYHYAEYLEHGHTYPFIEQALKDYIRAMEILYSEKS